LVNEDRFTMLTDTAPGPVTATIFLASSCTEVAQSAAELDGAKQSMTARRREEAWRGRPDEERSIFSMSRL
jgi:hypothetical protein